MRRDQDPVRVCADCRVAHWTCGVPGAGETRFERCGSQAQAEECASRLRADLTAGRNSRDHRTLDELAQTMLNEMRETNSPEGTIRQYRSNWNTRIPEEVGSVLCMAIDMAFHSFDGTGA